MTAVALVTGALVVVVLVLSGRDDGPAEVGGTTSAAIPTTTAPLSTIKPIAGVSMPVVRTPTDLADGRSLGSADAPVQLDLWSDYQCPACDAFAGSVAPELVEKYIRPGKARLTIHDMTTIGNESLGASISARCSERQGKYWEYHDLLFANQAPENSGTFTRKRSQQFARALGLDVDAFTTCLDDTDVQDAINLDQKAGFDKGVKETPSLFVNGELVSSANSWEPVASAIDAALEGS